MNKIKIIVPALNLNWEAELSETPNAKELYNKLPLSGTVNRWGEEIYFSVALDFPLEEGAKDEVALGDVGYWPPGKAICIFFGPTPISTKNKIIPASPVNIIGKVRSGVELFHNVKAGTKIILEKVD